MGKKKKPKPVDLHFALGGPNILTSGDKAKDTKDVLKLVYSGVETDVANVTVALIETDEDESIDPAVKGKDTTIATFVGNITKGAFVTDSATIATDKLSDDAPFIRVAIGGKEFPKVKLPGAESENGLFELRVVATAGASRFRSEWRAFARHYTIRPAEGPVMAFVTGAEDKKFFTAARKFWKQHADAVLTKDGMSLEEIVRFLLKHREGFGDYGEINIVAHGNRLSALLRIVQGGQRELRLETLDQTLGIEGSASDDPATAAQQAANAEKFAHTAAELGLGAQSRVVFRACNIGRRPDLLQAVRKRIFADACKVFAPKFLQAYSDGDLITHKLVPPFEFFAEDLQCYVPGKVTPPRAPNKVPDGTSQEELMKPIFARAHPTLKFEDEKGSYEAKITPRSATFTLSGTEGSFFDFVANARKTDDQLAAEMQVGFDGKRVEGLEFTRWKQWKTVSISRKDVTTGKGKSATVVTTDNLWVTVSGKPAVPHESFASPGGDLVLGSDASLGQAKKPAKPTDEQERPPGITLADKSIAKQHATISTGGAPSVEVTATSGNNIVFHKKAVGSFSGTVPLSFAVGPYAIALRREKERIATDKLARTLIHWRRPLRKDDIAVPYGEKRPLVPPDPINSENFGSSDDPIPTDEELAKLFE